ncbi:MAG: SpoIIIAH-like family protein [Clostridia bacterium]|nr:SpoIIIAH-like family protein [Clostridia bacterium]
MTIKKRHWALAGLVLALGTAVYLNWQFSPSTEYVQSTADTSASQEEYFGDAALAGATPVEAPASSSDTVSAAVQTDSLEKFRGERTTARNEALATLQDIIDDASLSDSEKSAAVTAAAQIAKRMEAESAAEALIKAKGFKDCVVIISDSQVNVILLPSGNGIDASTVAIIQDIVMGQTEISPSAIKIIEAK